MYVVNDSRYSNDALNPLIEFVAARCSFARNAWIHMHNSDKHNPAEVMTGGVAEKYAPFPLDSFTVPSRVSLWLRLDKPSAYPFRTCHRKRSGYVTINNWQEEFLFVLAHELRHIDQFWSLSVPVHYEVDAERFAMKVLQEYREVIATSKLKNAA